MELKQDEHLSPSPTDCGCWDCCLPRMFCIKRQNEEEPRNRERVEKLQKQEQAASKELQELASLLEKHKALTREIRQINEFLQEVIEAYRSHNPTAEKVIGVLDTIGAWIKLGEQLWERERKQQAEREEMKGQEGVKDGPYTQTYVVKFNVSCREVEPNTGEAETQTEEELPRPSAAEEPASEGEHSREETENWVILA